jgi:hypothetical protein
MPFRRFLGGKEPFVQHVDDDEGHRRPDEQAQKVPGDPDEGLLAPGVLIDPEKLHADYESRMARVTRLSISGTLK